MENTQANVFEQCTNEVCMIPLGMLSTHETKWHIRHVEKIANRPVDPIGMIATNSYKYQNTPTPLFIKTPAAIYKLLHAQLEQ